MIKLGLIAGILLSAPLASAAPIAPLTIQGAVLDPLGRGISNVDVSTDEVDVSTDTDPDGRFTFNIPKERPTIRLYFKKRNYFPGDQLVKLPLSGDFSIVLEPQFTRVAVPSLPSAESSSLRDFRAAEILAVENFLGGKSERKLLTINGLPGVDARETLLAVVKGKKSLFWLPCEKGENVLDVALELSKAIGDRHVAELARHASQEPDSNRRSLLKEAAIRETVRSLDTTSRIVVLENFDRWLARDKLSLPDDLDKFLSLALIGSHKLRFITLATADTHFSPSVEVLRERLAVEGLSTSQESKESEVVLSPAARYFKSFLGPQLADLSLQKISEHYSGHPLSLRLLAARLNRLDPSQVEGHVRGILATPGAQPDQPELKQSFDELYARLTSEEARSLEIMAMSAVPLSAEDITEIGMATDHHLTLERSVETALGGLVSNLRLVRAQSLGSPKAVHYSVPEVVRDYLNQRLAADNLLRRELHASFYHWYSNKLEVHLGLTPRVLETTEVSPYEELTRHAFGLAELSSGVIRTDAIITGARSALAVQGVRSREHNQRASVAEMRQALLLLQELPPGEALELRANCTLAYAYALDDNIEAERWFTKAHKLYTALGNRQGLARVLQVRGDRQFFSGDLKGARSLLIKALAESESAENNPDKAHILRKLGEIEMRFENNSAAIDYLDHAAAIYEITSNQHGLAVTLLRHGQILQGQREFVAAQQVFSRTLKLADSEQFSWLWASVLDSLAEVRGELGDVAGAETDHRRALSVFEAVEDKLGATNSRFGLAVCDARRAVQADSDLERVAALKEMEKVRDLYIAINEPVGRIRSGLMLTSELNDLRRTKEAATEFLSTLLLIVNHSGQRSAIIESCQAIRKDTDTESFDAEIALQLKTLLPTEQVKVQALLSEIRQFSPTPARRAG